MTVARGFLIIVLSGLAFAAGGGLTGYTLAVLLPAYYRGVFRGGREPGFDPVAVGLGLGVTQGAVCGVLVGAVVVLAVAWYNSRRGTLAVHLPPHQARRLAGPPERPRGSEGPPADNLPPLDPPAHRPHVRGKSGTAPDALPGRE